jgi:hypothetical protein
MSKFFTLAALLLLAGSTHAQVVYKCVGKGGKVEYSSWPCAKDQRTEREVAAIPEPVRQYAAPPAPARVDSTGQTNYFYKAPRQPSERDVQMVKCKQAKQWRENELRRLGLRRNFDDLRRIDDWVNQQCSGL